MNTKSRRRGFTLPEILVTVTIIAVLAAVVVPAVTQFSSSGDTAATTSDINAIKGGVTAYVTANHTYPTSLYDLVPYVSLNLGTTATSASTYKAAGTGFTIAAAFTTTTEGSIKYLTISLSNPANTAKTCDDFDKAFDQTSSPSGTTGAFRYTAATAPCSATYLLIAE